MTRRSIGGCNNATRASAIGIVVARSGSALEPTTWARLLRRSRASGRTLADAGRVVLARHGWAGGPDQIESPALGIPRGAQGEGRWRRRGGGGSGGGTRGRAGARGGRRRRRPPWWSPWAPRRGEQEAVWRQEGGDRVGPTDRGGAEVPSIEGMERGF
jgi:hypothetical protein